MISSVRTLLGFLRPPNPSDSPEIHHNWRVSITATVIAVAAFMVAFSLYTEGMTPLGGHATREEVRRLSERFDAMESSALEMQMLEMRSRQCRAIAENNKAAKMFMTERIIAFSNRHRKITGAEWRMPACEEVI